MPVTRNVMIWSGSTPNISTEYLIKFIHYLLDTVMLLESDNLDSFDINT